MKYFGLHYFTAFSKDHTQNRQSPVTSESRNTCTQIKSRFNSAEGTTTFAALCRKTLPVENKQATCTYRPSCLTICAQPTN